MSRNLNLFFKSSSLVQGELTLSHETPNVGRGHSTGLSDLEVYAGVHVYSEDRRFMSFQTWNPGGHPVMS